MTFSASTDAAPLDLLVTGGRLALPDGERTGSIGVREGRIVAILPPGEVRPADRVVDVEGLIILPGLVDMHVHFREPGQTHKETFETGTAAAAVGGFTTVADMPNTVPPTTTAVRLAEKRRLATGHSWVDVGLWGGAGTGAAVAELARAGAVGIKVYLGLEGDGPAHADAPTELVVPDDAALIDILQAATENGLVVAVHCGNRALRARGRTGWLGLGFRDLREAIARESQLHKVEAVARVLLLGRDVGARVHIVHVPAPALPEIRRAKDAGAEVTAEAALPFMTHDELDDAAELGFDRYRSPADADALWAAARDGTVDVLATDHAPHTLEEKRSGRVDLLAAPSGYPELDTALPMLLDAVDRGRLSLTRLIELMGRAPARILSLPGKGQLAVGMDADFVVIDPRRQAVVDRARLQTKNRWSPFEGRQLTGWPVSTWLRGEAVAIDGQLTGRPGGRVLDGSGLSDPSGAGRPPAAPR